MYGRVIKFAVLALMLNSMIAGCKKSDDSDATAVPKPKTEIADETPESKLYETGDFDKSKCFIVISKKNLSLSVYAPNGKDTILVARYPVCLSKNLGNKERSGDCRTPESTLDKPFTVSQIQNSSTWVHDFNDGRGPIQAYGNWFLRLETGFSGIGIHGSTNNEDKVPGRDSEGCIRLRDNDIVHLKENYVYQGMPVIIKGEDEGSLPFEKRLGNSSAKPTVITPALKKAEE